jgi:Kef-type K+ transport system membrane component KefB
MVETARAAARRFNLRGALRIGAGMIPRGEVALIIAGIGLASGILDNQLFGVIILMILAPRKSGGPHLQLLAAIAAVLQNDETRQKALEAISRPQVVALLTKKRPKLPDSP